MQYTWRWFGPSDPVTLADIRQTGATGVVSALHELPLDQIWPVAAIEQRKRQIEEAGLEWSVVESVPVPETIKHGGAASTEAIARFAQTLRNLAACGLEVICYNFMPVLDWTRTDLAYPLTAGGTALRFDQIAFAAFDLYLLERAGAHADYSDAERAAARRYLDTLDSPSRARLVANIVAGLPGADAGYTLDSFRDALAAYAGIDAATLQAHLGAFLEAVIPVAQACGIRLAIHPDDPPLPLLGLPRVVSTAADAQWIVERVPSPANGLTLCTGSYGVRSDNDLVAMTRQFAPWIHFVHLRNTRRDADDARSFHEADHLDGDTDLVGVMAALVTEEYRRDKAGLSHPSLPVRPDHGHCLLDDFTRPARPGYALIGRLKGLAELRGVEQAVRWQNRL